MFVYDFKLICLYIFGLFVYVVLCCLLNYNLLYDNNFCLYGNVFLKCGLYGLLLYDKRWNY